MAGPGALAREKAEYPWKLPCGCTTELFRLRSSREREAVVSGGVKVVTVPPKGIEAMT